MARIDDYPVRYFWVGFYCALIAVVLLTWVLT